MEILWFLSDNDYSTMATECLLSPKIKPNC